MANVKFPRKEFEKLLGLKIDSKLEEKIHLFGTPLESLSSEEIELEIFPNRPDLLSMQGFLRAFKAFLNLKNSLGLKKYNLKKPKENYKVLINQSVKNVRPYTACAIIKKLNFTDASIKEIIDLQEKIHTTIGRNRKKVAVGIYPLEKIKLPIRYTALDPKKIIFVPLESEKEMNGFQILTKHPTGREYSNILDGENKYPVFIDANDNILSMPPIINSKETGKISENTKEIFIECSGFDILTLKKTLNIIVTTLSDIGGEIYQLSLDYGKEKFITPDMTTEKIKISPEEINKTLGLNLKDSDLQRLIPRMGLNYKNKIVEVPSWRTDILHPIDITEDIAISYGYNKLLPLIPKVSTIAEESNDGKLKKKISETLLGLGLTEISTYHLIKEHEAKLAQLKNKIELENSKTEYKILRPNLFIPLLRILTENKNTDYPQKLFEMGNVFSKNEKTETGIIEKENLIVALSPGNFTEIKQVLDYLISTLDLKYNLEELENQFLIPGRTGNIIINGKIIGYMGEVHPKTLNQWKLKMPLSILEINLKELFNLISD